ncbi:transposase [Streptomyces sp. NPDC048595]|uniref:transposase n=1 Tax=Streptomyces sp. NPDC048595 TaxID=3365576 RepID=UPI0037156D4F
MPAPLSSKGGKPGQPPIWTRRQLIDGIRFRVRTGILWWDMPDKYGPWVGCTTCSTTVVENRRGDRLLPSWMFQKPGREIYEIAAGRAGVATHRCLFVEIGWRTSTPRSRSG